MHEPGCEGQVRAIEDSLAANSFPVRCHLDTPVLPGCRNCGLDIFAHLGRLPRRCPGWRRP